VDAHDIEGALPPAPIHHYFYPLSRTPFRHCLYTAPRPFLPLIPHASLIFFPVHPFLPPLAVPQLQPDRQRRRPGPRRRAAGPPSPDDTVPLVSSTRGGFKGTRGAGRRSEGKRAGAEAEGRGGGAGAGGSEQRERMRGSEALRVDRRLTWLRSWAAGSARGLGFAEADPKCRGYLEQSGAEKERFMCAFVRAYAHASVRASVRACVRSLLYCICAGVCFCVCACARV
jgi:hypothetical protein